MRSLLLTATLFLCAVGCNQAASSPAATEDVAVASSAAASSTAASSTAASSTMTASLDSSDPAIPLARPVCPSRWTCDSNTYYQMQAACEAACGSVACFREIYCTPGCICP